VTVRSQYFLIHTKKQTHYLRNKIKHSVSGRTTSVSWGGQGVLSVYRVMKGEVFQSKSEEMGLLGG